MSTIDDWGRECDECGCEMEWQQDYCYDENFRVVKDGGSWECTNQNCGKPEPEPETEEENE